MRSLLLIVLCSLFYISSNAQTEKGKIILGGNIDVNFFIQDSNRVFTIGIRPSVGVFAFKNFVIGGSYQFNVSANMKEKVQNYNTLIGPYVRYYVGKKDVKGFATLMGGYQVATRIKNGNVGNLNGFYAGGNIGVAYFFNPYVALESNVYVMSSGFEGLFPSTRIGVGIGVQVFIDKKKKNE